MAMSVPEPQLLLWTAAPDFVGGMIILQQQATVIICPDTARWRSTGPCCSLLLHADMSPTPVPMLKATGLKQYMQKLMSPVLLMSGTCISQQPAHYWYAEPGCRLLSALQVCWKCPFGGQVQLTA